MNLSVVEAEYSGKYYQSMTVDWEDAPLESQPGVKKIAILSCIHPPSVKV